MLTGKGRLPLRSSWCSSVSLLYQPIISGSSADIKTAVTDFALGRNTAVNLKWWNGESWEYPVFYQKLLNPNPTHWATTPATLSEAVNRLAAAVYTLSASTPIP